MSLIKLRRNGLEDSQRTQMGNELSVSILVTLLPLSKRKFSGQCIIERPLRSAHVHLLFIIIALHPEL
jgi:hypothetical protein